MLLFRELFFPSWNIFAYNFLSCRSFLRLFFCHFHNELKFDVFVFYVRAIWTKDSVALEHLKVRLFLFVAKLDVADFVNDKAHSIDVLLLPGLHRRIL